MALLNKPCLSLRFQLSVMLGCALIALWGAILWQCLKSENDALTRIERETSALALAYAEHTESIFLRADDLLLDLRDIWSNNPSTFAETVKERETYLAKTASQITVLSADGKLIFSNRLLPKESVYLGDREYFSTHRQSTVDRLYVSRPVKGRVTGKWSIWLSRPMYQNGHFQGVIALAIDPEFLASFYSKIDLGEQGLVLVVRDTGEIMVRSLGAEEYLGKSVSTAPYTDPGAPSHGVLRRRSQADGVERITGYYRLPERNLTVRIGAGVEEQLEPVRQQQRTMLGIATGITLLLAMMVMQIRRGLKRQESAESEARRANLAKSQFLATISHELRTPLSSIVGLSQMLSRGDTSERERDDYLKIIATSGQGLLKLVDDILDLTTAETGELGLRQSDFVPGKLLTEVCDIFTPLAKGKRLTLSTQTNFPGDQSFLGDPIRIKQVLSNLIDNAIKFTPYGRVVIEAREILRDDNGALLEFAVQDSGMGISPGEREALLMAAGTSSLDKSQSGRPGLGLAIARNLVELMHGEIGVESVVGEGSRFWFRIRVPIFQKSASAGENPAHTEPGREKHLSLQGKRILVADDEPANRKLMSILLEKQGGKVILVDDGQKCIDAIRHGNIPDLILMDIGMPVVDGIAATKAIRLWEEENAAPRLPIVALTANVDDKIRQRCQEAGMDDFLTKPLDLDKLEALFRQLLALPTSDVA